MANESEMAELLWQRDSARANLVPLEIENRRLKMLLRYAEEAIMAEYTLRTTSTGIAQK